MSHDLKDLDVLVGDWSVEASFDADVKGATTFEWMTGGKFLIQRATVEHPAAPDSLAVIGYDEDRGTYLQHYFDTRGVARVYEMSLTGGVWRLMRNEPDFSPLDFSQRWEATISADRNVIRGRWETSTGGSEWELDFEMTYTRIA